MRALKKGTAGCLFVLATLSWTLTPESAHATSPAQFLNQASLGIAETGRWLTAKVIDLGERLARRYDAAVTISYAAPRGSIAPVASKDYLLLAAPVARTAAYAYPTGVVTEPAVAHSDSDPTAVTSNEDLVRAQVQGAIDALGSSLRQELLTLGRQATAGLFAAIALSNRIDTLNRVSLVGATVAGVTGLTDADLPDDLTASNYLALGGGVLSGGLILGNASSTDLYSSLLRAGTGVITALSATSATVTDLVATSLSGTNASFTAATTTNATSTSLAVSGTATTSRLVVSNAFSFQAVTGFLKATAGVVATALIDLASDVSGILPVANGGTGWASIQSGAIPYGNGTNQFATTTQATPGYILAYLNNIPTWVASSTLATISGTLDVLKGGTGATSFGQGWLYSDGGTTALAASTSPTVNYIVATSTVASILPYASTTALTSSGSAYFATSGGNVGVGTSSPFRKFSVAGVVQADGYYVGNAGSLIGADQGFGVEIISDSSSAAPYIDWANTVGENWDFRQQFQPTSNVLTLAASTSPSQFVLHGNGNVGIGTSTPWAKLAVESNNLGTAPAFVVGSSTATKFIVTNGGNVGLGASNPGSRLSFGVQGGEGIVNTIRVYDDGGAITSDASNSYGIGMRIADGRLAFSSGIEGYHAFYTSNIERVRINSVGRVGIGTTNFYSATTRVQVAYTGGGSEYGIEFQPGADGACALHFINAARSAVGSVCNTNSATNYNTSSDRRIKDNITSTTLGLDTLMRLTVRDFSFKSDETHSTTTGFIAQELHEVFPWAVTTNGDSGSDPLTGTSTPWSVDYGRVTPLIVKAVQDIASLGDTFRHTLAAWLADAANGLTVVSAKEGKFSEQICIGATCVTERELRAVIVKPVGVSAPDEIPPSAAASSTERGLERQIVD